LQNKCLVCGTLAPMPRKFRTPEGRELARRRFRRIALLWMGVAVVCVGVLLFTLWRPFLRVEHVLVGGEVFAAEEDVRAAVHEALEGVRLYGVPYDSGVFLARTAIRTALLERFPVIRDVAIRRIGFNTVQIVGLQREAIARWCGDVVPPDIVFGNEERGKYGSCFSVDRNGFTFAPVGIVEVGIGVRYYGALAGSPPVGQQVASPEEFAALRLLTDALAAAGQSISALLIVDEREIEFALTDGTWVRVLRSDAPETIIDRLITTLSSDAIDTEKTLEYVDMRFGNKVYVKYREDVGNNSDAAEEGVVTEETEEGDGRSEEE
jgi:cell division septal protein FtsQ